MDSSAPTTSAQALQNLQGFQSSMKAPDAILQSQEQAQGVPAAQQQVSGLRQAITNSTNLLNQVAPSVYGRTGNSLVTDAQATHQIANEQQPINEQLNKEDQDYSGANADLQTGLSRAQTAAGLDLTGQQQQLSNLKDIYSALYGQEQDALAHQLDEKKLALAASGSGSGNITINPSNPAGGNYGSSPAATSAVQQDAYNEVKTRGSQQTPAQLTSDYLATAASAKNGNQRDLYKLQTYQQLFPQLFSKKYSWQ